MAQGKAPPQDQPVRVTIIDPSTPPTHMKTPHIIAPAVVALIAFAAIPSVKAEEGQRPQNAAEEPSKPKVKPYTLDTCIVSDDKLGEMGKPVVFTYKDQEIKLCCKACRKDLDKDPAKYLKKLEPKK